MKAVYQASFSCLVERKAEELLIKSTFISTDYEASAQLKVDISSFRINQAHWDMFRSPDGYMIMSREIPELIGVEAYLYSGSQIRKAVGEEMNGIPLELIIECIRGVGQAEAFLIFERGFPSLKIFDEYCHEVGLNSCHYYSNLDRIAMTWTEYMGDHSTSRDKELFYRHKNYCIFLQSDGSLLTSAGFIDSFHEIALIIALSQEGLILECSGNLLRGPDRICYETVELLPRLAGKNLAAASKKEIAGWLGGPQGCTHLFEMFWDLGSTIAGFQKRN